MAMKNIAAAPLGALLALALAGGASSAWSQEAPKADKPGSTIIVGGEARITDRTVIADGKVVVAAYQALRSEGYPALKRHLPDLNKALDRAPASYPRVEASDGRILVRADPGDGLEGMVAASLVAAAMQKTSVTIEHTLNIYPLVSLLLASSSLESGDTAGAIAYLDRGLKLQPKSGMLLTEKGAALLMAGRPAEALAAYDAGLAMDDLTDMQTQAKRALLQRGRGYALSALGRHDEAITAYEEALKEDPADRVAKSELAYVRSLKAARP